MIRELLVRLGLIREDAITTIFRKQSEIVDINAQARALTSLASDRIEEAVDAELDAIRATVAAGFHHINVLATTGALTKSVNAALAQASVDIERALSNVDEAIDPSFAPAAAAA